MKITSTRATAGDKVFDIFNFVLMSLILLAILYPLYFVVIGSFSDPNEINSGRMWLLPRGLNVEGYKRIFNDPSIRIGYRNSAIYMFLGTAINLAVTLPGAYALSRKGLPGRNLIMLMIVFTMFFQGGLIPRFLLVLKLGMVNTIFAMIIPEAVVVWNLIVTRTFFQTNIPDELWDSTRIDGCSNTAFFFLIALPLSKAIIAVMALFYGVSHWNSFFDALIFLRDEKLYPLQIILRNILIQNEARTSDMLYGVEAADDQMEIAEMIKYGLIIVANIPLLIMYPLVQRYFVQGVQLGAIKG